MTLPRNKPKSFAEGLREWNRKRKKETSTNLNNRKDNMKTLNVLYNYNPQKSFSIFNLKVTWDDARAAMYARENKSMVEGDITDHWLVFKVSEPLSQLQKVQIKDMVRSLLDAI